MIPKSYTKQQRPSCQDCKYLINIYFCSFNETLSHEELVKDTKWLYDNEVYVQGCCDMFEQRKFLRFCRHCATQTELDEFGFCENCIYESTNTDGSVLKDVNGNKFWYFKNKLHRTDGPAIEGSDGYKEWWLEGREYTEEEFLKKTSPVKELTVEET